MPDWTYQTVFRPVLRQFSFAKAQTLAFGVMSLLGRNPVGRTVISFLGHSAPTADLSFQSGDLQIPSPTALGCGIDQQARAISTVSLFGFGLIEVGPLEVGFATPTTSDSNRPTEWDASGLSMPEEPNAVSMDAIVDSLHRNSFRNSVPVIVRLRVDDQTDIAEFKSLLQRLGPVAQGVSLACPTERSESESGELKRLVDSAHNVGLKVLLVSGVGAKDSASGVCDKANSLNADGIILHGIHHAAAEHDEQKNHLSNEILKARQAGFQKLIIAREDVRQPADALPLIAAGAQMVMVDTGFADAGPGLPKRINAAVRAARQTGHDQPSDQQIEQKIPVPHYSWFWSFLLGLSLLIGGLMALMIGTTRVLLPYDEEFLGMLRDEICGLNNQLLPFMSHDRVTLAGTMLGLGPLYLLFAWYGDRRGMHWARVAVLASSFVGFISFFFFLGFGYFDPFHAFISAILFQLMALGLRSSQGLERLQLVDLYNSAAWKRAMWGQLLMVAHGGAILLAGIIISSFGVSTVFVEDDLEFMQTTREALVSANPRLVPLVAHDRASFGGMLMATGITVLLSCVWGWQAERRWLWWALLGSGTVSYTTAILIHWYVGYTSLRHLLPAYGGLGVLWLAMWLAREWMTMAGPQKSSAQAYLPSTSAPGISS